MKKILLGGYVPENCLNMLEEQFELFKLYEADNKSAYLLEHGYKIEGLTGGAVNADLIAQLPNLEVIANYGVGYDAVDVDAARAAGVQVSNTPGRLNAAVAELTLGLMVSLARNIPAYHNFVKAGRWAEEGRVPLTGQLAGAKVGIVGLGRIGKDIAKRCVAFDMDVSYHGRREQTDQPFKYYASLIEMATDVDWLVLIAPGGADTKGLISKEVLQALGPTGHFVNIARGAMVDQQAMIELLGSGALGGAALDVFDGEPEVPEQLLQLDNVVLSPHNGSATHATRDQMSAQVVENLIAYFETGEVNARVV